MSITRWDPFDDISMLRRSMERAFDDFFTPRRTAREDAAARSFVWEPAVEMFETDGEIVVRAELPNVDPKTVDVTVTQDAITLKGESRTETEEKGRNYHRRELRYGTFVRTLPLGTEVKNGEAKATYKDGVLDVRIPKSERVKPTSVKVQVG
jgi:HSP20 family protein